MVSIKYTKTNEEITLNVVLVPKSSRDDIVGALGEELKIAITATPVDGKANEHVIKYLAKLFKTSKSMVSIIKGETSKHKIIKIKGYQVIPQKIEELLD